MNCIIGGKGRKSVYRLKLIKYTDLSYDKTYINCKRNR